MGKSRLGPCVAHVCVTCWESKHGFTGSPGGVLDRQAVYISHTELRGNTHKIGGGSQYYTRGDRGDHILHAESILVSAWLHDPPVNISPGVGRACGL